MFEQTLAETFLEELRTTDLRLEDGSRVAVIGGGPSGSYFAYFALDMAELAGLDITIDIYEPRDYTVPGPTGCNMCGGIISESLVQMLATEGINLPPSTIQRGIDSYVLHMDVGSVEIKTPLAEKRIGAVHRGAGPRGVENHKWDSFDGFLQNLAIEQGANVIHERVSMVNWDNGRPEIHVRDRTPQTYDLIVVAVGVNTSALKLFQDSSLAAFAPPDTTKAFICEYKLGEKVIEEHLGSSMHVFLLDIPHLEFAAAIPKGDYVSVCLLGEDINKELVSTFLNAPEVVNCMPPGWEATGHSCQCAPRLNIRGAQEPFSNRIVFIGDCAITRLYKDGIGGAYRAAKAAASTVIFEGISAEDFRRSYYPVVNTIENDNKLGKIVFKVAGIIQRLRFSRHAMLRMTAAEQKSNGSRQMSMVLWDMFTGSASYKEIFFRTLNPGYLVRFAFYLITSFFAPKRAEKLWGGSSRPH